MPASPLRDPKNWHFSRNTAPAWAIIAVSLVVTVIASLQVKQALEADTLRRFSFSCDQVTLKIQTRLDTYATILRGASALFAASEKVNRKEWRAYVHTL
jgi:CHASE1-domain containing sensor protein